MAEEKKEKKITVTDMLVSLTQDFVIGDSDSYKKSKNAHALCQIGKDVIPRIGSYMKSIEAVLNVMETEDREEIEMGWVKFLKFLVVEFEIDIEYHQRSTNHIFFSFEDWANWASEYDPKKY